MTEKKHADAFAALGLDKRLTAVLAELGYEEPTPVQLQAIPVLLEGRDLLGQAATGTGKTAAFALPLLQRLFVEAESRDAVAALVLVPTRELAMQVAEALHRYGRPVQLRVLPIYGGQPISLQLRALRRGVDVVVATPGRARDHLRRGTLVLSGIRAVVLDEADEMLDMGFAEDLEAILAGVPSERQTALFSATIPSRIAAIAKRHMRNAVRLTIEEEHTHAGALPRVRQVAYVVTRAQKVDGLSRVLDLENPTSALVFCRTRNEVEELAQSLAGRGHRAEALHGGFTQVQRDRVMRRFREGAADLLLATDVAARGLDIRHLTHVVNFDVPSAPESYVHRIGRTGRAGAEGVAITLVEPRERSLLKNIERLTGRRIAVQALPTVADLRARRLELTRASLREALVRGGTEGARVVVEALAAEFELFEIATAAVHLIQEASERDGARATADDTPPETSVPTTIEQDFTRIYVSAGRAAGVRPADLVGAITGEAAVPGEAVGAIELGDRFALVEVRESDADAVVEALRRATIRGRRVTASRYREPRTKPKAAPSPRAPQRAPRGGPPSRTKATRNR
jgi:ATP-dependent RNA helicase DeaD